MLRLYGIYRLGGLIGSLMKIPYNGRTSEHLKFRPKSQTILKKIEDEKTGNPPCPPLRKEEENGT